MSYLITQPQALASAAADVAGIGSAISAANEAAAGPTTGVLSAAGDEVSAATATLFNTYAQEYQAIGTQAAAFHDGFVHALAAAGNTYAEAEAAIAAALSGGAGASPATARPAAPGPNYVTLVMGPSGTPIPSLSYVTAVVNRYVTPNFSNFIATYAQSLFTPEGFYPVTGIKDLTLNISVARGVTILHDAIMQQLNAGNHVAVVGYSQSALVASLEMQQLDPAGTPSSLPVSFVLLGNPMNPNGGLFSRFAGLNVPSLGLTFYGSTPSNSFPTANYSIEYDGAADFPRYPINIVSDLNAFLGFYYGVHGTYPNLTSAQLDSAIILPTQGPTQTTYYMIPTQNLPLLNPVRAVPFVGGPLADLLQPDLKVIVNLGYGDPAYGYSTSPANVPTPFGLFPPVDPQTVLAALGTGTQQGIVNAASDVRAAGFPSLPSISPSGLSHLLTSNPSAPNTVAAPTFSAATIDSVLVGLQSANTNGANAFTNALATGYSTLLPTADILNAGFTAFPSYSDNLFLDGISQAVNGQPLLGLIHAIGYPVAATTALVPLGIFLEFLILSSAAKSIVGDFTSL